MLNRAQFDAVCDALPGTTHVVQWGGSSVWKVGGKIFAMCSPWNAGTEERISFKCSDLAYQVLTEMPGIIPAPYLARAKWVQIVAADAMSDDDLKAHLAAAHALIARRLTKAQRRELGLDAPPHDALSRA